MKLLITLLIFIWTSLSAADWQTYSAELLEKAQAEKKPVILDFYADWCGPCKKMEEETFTDANVLKEFKDVLLIRVDIDKEVDFSREHQVSSIPHIIYLNRLGEKTAEIKGFRPANIFVKWLQEKRSLAFSDKSLHELSEEESLALKSLKQSDIEKLLQIAVKHFKNNRRPRSSLIVAEMEKALKDQPQQLLRSINHNRLEIRLLALQIYTRLSGKKIDFDVWASTEERKKSLFDLMQDKPE